LLNVIRSDPLKSIVSHMPEHYLTLDKNLQQMLHCALCG